MCETSSSISEWEKRFVMDGVEVDCRVDGRRRCDIRPLHLECDVLSSTAFGSCRVQMADTDVLVTVKGELDEYHQSSVDEKTKLSPFLEFSVDCSPNASPSFEETKGGFSTSPIVSELISILNSVYNNSNNVFNTSSLIIKKSGEEGTAGKGVRWILRVDILVLGIGGGGNLYDVVSMSVKGALFDTSIPKVEICSVDGDEMELEISDNICNSTRLDVSNCPLFVTVSRIGSIAESINSLVVDSSLEEGACATSIVVVASCPEAPSHPTCVRTCSSQSSLAASSSRSSGSSGSSLISGTFHISTLSSAIHLATSVLKVLHGTLKSTLIDEESERLKFQMEKASQMQVDVSVARDEIRAGFLF